MYETADQKRPVLDVKGLEVVRRDGCPALVKIMDQSLRILFRSLDMSQVEAYFIYCVHGSHHIDLFSVV